MADSAKDPGLTNNDPEYRSFTTKATKKAKYKNAFDVNSKVWVKNPKNALFEWVMFVTATKCENDTWEYRLRTPEGVVYGNDEGSWVGEGSLRDAG